MFQQLLASSCWWALALSNVFLGSQYINRRCRVSLHFVVNDYMFRPPIFQPMVGRISLDWYSAKTCHVLGHSSWKTPNSFKSGNSFLRCFPQRFQPNAVCCSVIRLLTSQHKANSFLFTAFHASVLGQTLIRVNISFLKWDIFGGYRNCFLSLLYSVCMTTDKSYVFFWLAMDCFCFISAFFFISTRTNWDKVWTNVNITFLPHPNIA